VLRVDTDDALRAETETTSERVRDTLTRSGVQTSAVEITAPDEFRITGVQNDAGLRDATTDIETVYDRTSGAGTYTFKIKPNIANQLRDEAVTQALETIERRVNELGVAEPVVARHGGREQILVQLPGVSNVQRAKEIIRSTAQLQFRLVEQGPFPTREAALQAYNNVLPGDAEILPGRQDGAGTAGTTGTVFYVVKKVSVVSGNDLRTATQSLDQFNRPAVAFTLKQDAAVRFGNFTQASIGRPLGIILDERVKRCRTWSSR
jgi:preprotein translocase subunit SecD